MTFEWMEDGIDESYRRFSAARKKGDFAKATDEFARLCDFLAQEKVPVSESVFDEMRLAWSDVFWEAGRPDRAAEILKEHLTDVPTDEEARGRLAACQFHACQFDKARSTLDQLDPHGAAASERLLYTAALAERDGDFESVERLHDELRRANAKFHMPIELTEDDVAAFFRRCLAAAPIEIRHAAADVPIYCSPLPSDEVLFASEPPVDPWVLGLFEGPGIDEGDIPGIVSPHILLFYRNIARIAHDKRELEAELRMTLFHEIGHYVGMDEEDLTKWEDECKPTAIDD